jgi:hypothetical protein
VVSTARIRSSWQIAINNALTPVESADVSSVRFPIPISISASGHRRRAFAYRSSEAMKPIPIGSRIGSIRYDTPHPSSFSIVGSSVSIEAPRSGTATHLTGLADRSRAISTFEPLTLRTALAPACTAVRISSTSKVSTLTRIPASTSSRTTSPSSGNARPGVQPMSMMSAPEVRYRSASCRTAARVILGTLLISARISMSHAP